MKPIDSEERPSAKLFRLDRASLLKIAFGTMIASFVLLVVRHQIRLLTHFEWGDEHETIVTAKMLASGSILYAEVFNHHGPLTFLSGYILETIGNFQVRGHRVPIAILQWIALAAIYFSPLVKDRIVRLVYTGLAASAMLLYLPAAFGNAYLYQGITGLLLVLILAQYTLPAICCPETLTTGKVAIGNLLIASLPFLAVTYVPISLLLFTCSLRGRFFRKSLAWFLAGIGLNTLLLIYIGSILGYLAYHLHMNLSVLAIYAGDHSLKTLVEVAIWNLVQPYQRSAILALIAVSIAKLAFAERGFPWRSLLVGMGIASLLIRGGHFFHGLPYYYAGLAFPLIFFHKLQPVTLRHKTFWLVGVMAISFFMVKLSLLIPSEREKFNARKIREVTEFSQLAQLFTSKGDKIIAYPFENLEYLAADRLPASGHFFYLPWQEKYNENPKFGIKIDACREIDIYRPKIMLIDTRPVLNIFPWESYGGCIQNIADKNYRQINRHLPARGYYVRKDFLADDMGIATAQEPYKLLPSDQLGARSPIPIFMTASHKNEQAGLKRIGVMFKTQATQNPGEAELRLKGGGGVEFVKRFTFANLVDNKYHHFEVDAKHYTSGEIVSIVGGGISTAQSHSEKNGVNTCIIYEYSNGKRRFTPGCPLV